MYMYLKATYLGRIQDFERKIWLACYYGVIGNKKKKSWKIKETLKIILFVTSQILTLVKVGEPGDISTFWDWTDGKYSGFPPLFFGIVIVVVVTLYIYNLHSQVSYDGA